MLVCDTRLAPLFRRSFPEASVIGYERRKDHRPVPLSRPVDWQVPAGSVPRFLRRAAEDFPRRRQFLHADAALVEQWRDRFQSLSGTLRVGVSWRGGGQPGEHRKRSINLAQWKPLLDIAGIDWINLQYGETSEERSWAESQLGVTIHDWPEGDPLIDLDAFAARVAALDLVISVDNATVHLAGALGVPTWVILPQIPNWRWATSGENSVWYASARLIRQTTAGTWRPVLQRLAGELPTWVNTHLGHERSAALAVRSTADVSLGNCPAPLVSAEITDAQATLRQAIAHFEAGRFEQSEALCRAVLCLAPRQVRGLHLMAQLCRRSGRRPQALDTIRRAGDSAAAGAVPRVGADPGRLGSRRRKPCAVRARSAHRSWLFARTTRSDPVSRKHSAADRTSRSARAIGFHVQLRFEIGPRA